MMRTFKDGIAKAVFSGLFVRELDRRLQQRAREKLKYLDCAAELRDLMILPKTCVNP